MICMDNQPVISVRNITKSFKVYFDKGQSFKERVLFKNRRKYETRVVLDDISFDIKKGEVVGLIGHNGCGKSTMLKLLTRIMYPDSGTVSIEGRVSSLIELGAGFHPDMSGRENIYINASIFGLTKNEIDEKLDDIISFSELGSYIDNPVRTYSSGMYMRLAFSVAINVSASILLIDEILAVGDASFQAKCFNRLRELKADGTTIVIVSHSLGQIEQICDRTIWIESGRIKLDGIPMDVHPRYLEYMSTKHDVGGGAEITPDPEQAGEEQTTSGEATADNAPPEEKQEKDPLRWGSDQIQFTKVYLKNDSGEITTSLVSGKPFSIVGEYRKNAPVDELVCGFGVFRNDNLQCYGTNTDIDRISIPVPKSQTGRIEITIPENDLLSGEYYLDIAFHKKDGFAFDYYRKALTFTVSAAVNDVGVARLKHQWELKED